MDEYERERSNLIWSCFVNWINTLEKVGVLNPLLERNLKELGKNQGVKKD